VPARPGTAVELAERVRAQGGTVVATGGCFDLLHAGHVRMLQSARALGDCLIVCMNTDASVRRIKGPDRPLVGEGDRAAVLDGLGCVDGLQVELAGAPQSAFSMSLVVDGEVQDVIECPTGGCPIFVFEGVHASEVTIVVETGEASDHLHLSPAEER
jgi:cytidyltransferase-like protein